MSKTDRFVRNRHAGRIRYAPETAKAHGNSTTLTVGAGGTAIRGITRVSAALGMALFLTACAVRTDPLTLEENAAGARADLAAMFAEVPPVTRPIGLYEAMARAIRDNLDGRLRAMEQALSQDQADVAAFALLPSIDAKAGVDSRSNVDASSSEAIDSGTESVEASTSSDRTRWSGDARAVWNVLDFGVSYYSARQASDRAKIAQERRRKVLHDIIQDVRSAYWRAVAAERLLDRIDPLMGRVERALGDSARIERLRLQSPIEALEYQRTLLDTLRRLNQLRRDLTLAKTELAALMDLPPRQDFTVAVPDIDALEPIRVDLTPDEIEILALTYRPELREERYQGRISQVETRKALLRMLPGIEFDTALTFDTNSFLVNHTWAGYGARITWNLLNLIRGPAAIEAAEAEEAVSEARRLAVSMAVLVQGHVAWINYHNALKDFETAEALRDVDARLRDQLAARGRAAATGDLPVIRGELDLLLSDLRRDLAYAQANNAAGAILLSIGADPLPETVADGSLETLAAAIREREAAWRRGNYQLPAPSEAEPAEDPAETVRRPAASGPGAAPVGTVPLLGDGMVRRAAPTPTPAG